MIVLRPLILVFLFLASLGCDHHRIKGEDNQKRYLQVSFANDIRSLNPSTGIDFPAAFVARMLFEGLMIIGSDGKVKPAIAESYDISEDLKTFTFYLRSAKWSNGDPVTAYDFEYSWKKILDPKTAADGVSNFYIIQNGRAAALGKVPLDHVGIKALDEKTLVIHLEHPTPYFLEVVASPSFLPVNTKIDRENPNWSSSVGEFFVCNGPYVLEKYRLEDEIIVKKNPTYWDTNNVKMPGIHIAIIKDQMTQLDLFTKKKLDWIGRPISKIPLDSIAQLKMKEKIQFTKTLGLYWYFINTEAFPFNHKKMRKAFAYAINRDLITRYILQGDEQPALSILPYYLSNQKNPFFQDNQKKLALQLFNEALSELGITRQDLPNITINYTSSPAHLRVATALQKQWSQIFEIPIKLENQEWRAHYGKLQGGNYQIGGMYWQSWLRDPSYILETFRYKSNGENMSQWENNKFQELLAASEEEIDPAQRQQLFNQAEEILLEEMPVIPVYFSTIAYGKNKKLHDVFISDLYEIDFRWSYFEE